MAQGTLTEAAQAMAGRLIAGDGDVRWDGAAIDSREVHGGELFFALPGDRTDGHRFVSKAAGNGAAASIVHQEVDAPEWGGLIRVNDTTAALHALTRKIRQRVPKCLVAITGSTGKTTTKELLAKMLASRYSTAASLGNFNNLLGFPLSMLNVAEGTDWMVAEMGMSTPGELSALSRMAEPDVVVLTNVRPVHLEFFPNLRGIADAKAELLEGLKPDGLLVANAGDPEVARIGRRHGGRVVWFGAGDDATHRAAQVELMNDGGSRFQWYADGDRLEVELPLLGHYNVENFLAAAACASALGVPPRQIAQAAGTAQPAAMRGVVLQIGGATVVDDSYNSNPAAVREALRSAAALPGARHLAVLGDMLELGAATAEYHRQAGEQAAGLGFSPVAGVGPAARELVAGATAGGAEAVWHADAAAAADWASQSVREGDVVLVKGSRGIGLEAVVQKLAGLGEAN